jgi:diaminopimelate epimerase
LDTLGGKVFVTILDQEGKLIKVDMGTVSFWSQEIPVAGTVREVVDESLELETGSYKVTCLSIGNPHCVIPLTEVSVKLAKDIGALIEVHSMFPNRINVQFLQVIDRSNILIEIWERGAGYTLASGSSSCAAACAAYKLGLVDSQPRVHMPGGIIEIEIGPDWQVQMTGAVSSVASGRFSDEMRHRLSM